MLTICALTLLSNSALFAAAEKKQSIFIPMQEGMVLRMLYVDDSSDVPYVTEIPESERQLGDVVTINTGLAWYVTQEFFTRKKEDIPTPYRWILDTHAVLEQRENVLAQRKELQQIESRKTDK